MFSWHTLTDGNTSELCVYSGWPLIFWWLLAVPTANREKFTHDISTNLCFFCMWNFVEVEAYIEVHYLCNISASQYLFMHLMFVIYCRFFCYIIFLLSLQHYHLDRTLCLLCWPLVRLAKCVIISQNSGSLLKWWKGSEGEIIHSSLLYTFTIKTAKMHGHNFFISPVKI